ncbi:MAG: AAA domain-containing protein, partial [Methanomassiliicoccales archaeon]
MSGDLFRIEVNQIGEYVQKGSCARRFKLDLNGRSIANKVPFFTRALNPLDPVLKEMGREREDLWERSLLDNGFELISSREGPGDRISWSEFIEMLASRSVAGRTIFSREVELTGTIGRFDLHGRCDFMVLHWKDGSPRLRIVECKASRKDKTYHRIQLAAYVLMVGALLDRDKPVIAGVPLGRDQVEGVVARIDVEDGNEPIMELAPFDLGTEVEDVKRLLSEGGDLDRITSADIGSLSYRIDSRCDSCLFSVICLPEAARVKGLELLDLDQSSMRVLRANGVTDLCSLSRLDPRSDGALKIRRTAGFSGNLESMVLKARARTSTLPGEDGRGYEVQRLPGLQIGLLPQYEQGEGRLVRVYMAVDRDYVEDRVVGLSAHITSSDGRIFTPFMKEGERWVPDPEPKERLPDDRRGAEPGTKVRGIDVVKIKRSPWSKDRAMDTEAEADLIRSFFIELMGAIAKVADRESAPIHFYLWKRNEMATLIEGCTRCGGELLGNLTELMGCRQPLEQLIYTIMDEEVRSRFALGWSGGGLVVAASLKWYGERYHWVRNVGGSVEDLSEAFRQGIFDFTSNVALRKDGTWARYGEEGSERHLFEVRSRNGDSLPVPYLHAMWGTLPSPEGPMRYSTRETIKRYTQGGSEPLITAYLKARVQALRWIEERVGPKNKDIAKPLFVIASLPDFQLRKGTPSNAAVDFLRMDHHVRFNEWMSGMSLPPLDRVAQGHSVPIREVMTVQEDDGHHFEAVLDLERFGETADGFRDKTSVEKGSWVRLTPYDGDALEQQRLSDVLRGGRTCIVEDIDLDSGRVRMKVMTFGQERYRLPSLEPREGIYCDFATLDESPSDMVSGRVDARLTNVPDAPSMRWFDMSSPEIPPVQELGKGVAVRYGSLLRGMRFDGLSLGEDQVAAILDGLSSRVQLMQGPPGTGKTTTTAVATLLRTTRQGPGEITLVAANTHMAIDRIIDEIRSKSGPLMDAMKGMGATPAPIGVYSLMELEKEGGYWRRLNTLRDSERSIVGGTTNEILKL